MTDKKIESNKQKSTTILLNHYEREALMRLKAMMEKHIEDKTGVKISVPMREVVVQAIKDKIAEMSARQK